MTHGAENNNGDKLRVTFDSDVSKEIAEIFEQSPDSVEKRLEAFPKYVKRQDFTRLFALFELYKKILSIKGSVINCGVFRGFSLMSFAHMSAILEPVNFMRRIYGFDTFSGFPTVDDKDHGREIGKVKVGDFSSDSLRELHAVIGNYDKNRFLGSKPKIELIKGDVRETIPSFLGKTPHLIVSLLYLDFDLYEPTKVALEYFYPRMPKGSIIAFDELDHPYWPGETQALLETIGISKLKLERFDFEPYISYAVL